MQMGTRCGDHPPVRFPRMQSAPQPQGTTPPLSERYPSSIWALRSGTRSQAMTVGLAIAEPIPAPF